MSLRLDYARRDLDQVLNDLQDTVRTTFPDWQDFLESDIGLTLLKTFAAVVDMFHFYLDRQAAESYLDSCELRPSAVSLAKALGYTTRDQATAHATVRMSLTAAYTEDITIPLHTTMQIGGLPFYTTAVGIIVEGQTFTDVSVAQGQYFTRTVTAPGTAWFKVTLPAAITGVIVTVDAVPWTRIGSFIYPDAVVLGYRLYEDTDGWVVEFGAGRTTAMPASGAVVVCTGTLTDGLAGNIPQTRLPVTITSQITNLADANITSLLTAETLGAPTGGADRESLASIKALAPAFYTTQNRVVTARDYETIARTVDGVVGARAWGGEEVGRYGEVFVAVYGDEPDSVSPTLLDDVAAKLAPLRVVPIVVNVIAPTIVTIDTAIILYLDPNTDVTLARNGADQAVIDYFDSLVVGQMVQHSVLLDALTEVDGVAYAALVFTAHVPGVIVAGLLTVQTIQFTDVSSLVVRDATSGERLWWTPNGGYQFTDDTLRVPIPGDGRAVTVTMTSRYPDVYILRHALAITGVITLTTRLAGRPE